MIGIKSITKYICDKCGKEYLIPKEAEECEVNHICVCKKYKHSEDIIIYKIQRINDSQEIKLYLDYTNKSIIMALDTILNNDMIKTDTIGIEMNYCPLCGEKI